MIYIIKENRSYDEVFGDVSNANGNADLCVFGERVTPNQHKLVREFTLLDNTYCSSILSADGHNWAASAIATEYVERSFASWPRSYPSGGGAYADDSLAYSPAGFIWDDALAHGKTFHDFGEFCSGKVYWTDPTRKGEPSFTDCYQNYISGSNDISFSATPDLEPLRPYFHARWPG